MSAKMDLLGLSLRTQLAINEARSKAACQQSGCDRVLLQLAARPLTPAAALADHKVGSLGYRSRVTELRQRGIEISARYIPVNKVTGAKAHYVFGLSEVVGND